METVKLVGDLVLGGDATAMATRKKESTSGGLTASEILSPLSSQQKHGGTQAAMV